MQTEMRMEIMAQLQDNAERLESQTQETFLKKVTNAAFFLNFDVCHIKE